MILSNEKLPVFTSCRWMVAHVSFVGTSVIFALWQTMSVTIVCIFPEGSGGRSGRANNSLSHLDSQHSRHNDTKELNWSPEIQGAVLSSLFYGYIVTPVFCGYLATRFGGKQVLLVCMLLAVLATVLTPSAILWSPYAVICLRAFVGLCTGANIPANQEILNRWTPAPEKSMLISYSYSGNNVGNVINFALAGLLCTVPFLGGWPLIFYVFGGGVSLWCLCLYLCVYNSPETHPRISEEEKHYILTNTPKSLLKQKRVQRIPLLSALTSFPLMACVVSQMVNSVTQMSTTYTLPMYMRDVLRYSVDQNGLLCAIPAFGRFIGMLLCGYFSDLAVEKGHLSVLAIRKTTLTLGCVIPAMCLVVISFLDQNERIVVVILLIVLSTLSSATMATIRFNVTDIAPRYASVLVGILSTITAITGIIVPAGVTVLTSNGSREEWQVVFLICTGLNLFSVVTYLIFARADEQDWARYENIDDREL